MVAIKITQPQHVVFVIGPCLMALCIYVAGQDVDAWVVDNFNVCADDTEVAEYAGEAYACEVVVTDAEVSVVVSWDVSVN